MNIDDILNGQDLEAMSDDELRKRVLYVDVYARVDPEHKLRLVRLLLEQGLVFAMTGDGVNDAPALKRADVGTAMGRKCGFALCWLPRRYCFWSNWKSGL